jgi:hypothetical protein
MVQANTDSLVYFWDTIDLSVRFLLLNQSQVAALSYNVSQQAQLNVSNLNWAALPLNVQSFLLGQSLPSVYSLTFEQWAWVSSSNAFYNSTLSSLLPTNVLSSLPDALILLAPISYNMQIDLTVLNQTLFSAIQNNGWHRKRGNLVRKFFESFYETVSLFLPQNKRFKRNPFERFHNRQPTALSTYNDAIRRAAQFVRSLRRYSKK